MKGNRFEVILRFEAFDEKGSPATKADSARMQLEWVREISLREEARAAMSPEGGVLKLRSMLAIPPESGKMSPELDKIDVKLDAEEDAARSKLVLTPGELAALNAESGQPTLKLVGGRE